MPNSPSYGSFGNTKVKVANINDIDTIRNTEDDDSGMSSEETDDSLKLSLSPIINNKNVREGVNQEVITKCLTFEPLCAEHRNEIPSCSNDVSFSVFIEQPNYLDNDLVKGENVYIDEPDCMERDVIINKKRIIDEPSYVNKDLIIDKKVSDFILVDVTTCDVETVCALSERKAALSTSDRKVNCDYSIPSVGTSQDLVPVVNKEIVQTENQKLLSLSLSILLAALLQAVRCFAQFLEDIVIPQR